MGVLGLRVDVHVLEQIAECEHVDVYASEKGGAQAWLYRYLLKVFTCEYSKQRHPFKLRWRRTYS